MNDDTMNNDIKNGDSMNSDTMNSDTMNSDTMSGDTMNGDTMSGDTMSGDTKNGDTKNDDTMSGDIVNSDIMNDDTHSKMDNSSPVLPPDRVRWKGFFTVRAIWPGDPDIFAIRTLVPKVLPKEYMHGKDLSLLEVQFFAQGAFNKIYEISHPDTEKIYLLRVSLAVEPFFKTESEVATIEYLHKHTTIPITRVVAWNSSSNNTIGHEWVLMEKMDGVQIHDVWRTISWDTKFEFTRSLAEYFCQLRDLTFDKIGSIYFQDVGNPEGIAEIDRVIKRRQHGETPFIHFHNPGSDSEHFTVVDHGGAGFEIGRMVSFTFFENERLYVPGNRGPYRNSREYLTERVKFTLNHVDKALEIARSKFPSDANDDYDDDFIECIPEMKSTCDAVLDYLPNIFPEPPEDEPPHILSHHDLNPGNVLVNPDTCTITGIIDWEMICVRPRWEGLEYPRLLMYQAPLSFETEEPPIPVDWEDRMDYGVYKRDRWDYSILRCAFDESVDDIAAEAGSENHIPFDKELQSYDRKKRFDEAVELLFDGWSQSQSILRHLKEEEEESSEEEDSGSEEDDEDSERESESAEGDDGGSEGVDDDSEMQNADSEAEAAGSGGVDAVSKTEDASLLRGDVLEDDQDDGVYPYYLIILGTLVIWHLFL
ncbi:Phosphotransferase enzyme [Arachnomyces sp. PD_36]|nr:Phosphotransferase enzyme [Arachnomyces sp. PD_36]